VALKTVHFNLGYHKFLSVHSASITNDVTLVLLKYSIMQLSKNIKHVQTRLAMAAVA